MGKKTGEKKRGQAGLTAEESMELQMILDRLSVQVPNGESFQAYLASLRKILERRERLVTELLSHLSRKPSAVGFRTYQALEGLVTDRTLRKALRQAAYRFSQKGFSTPTRGAPQERVVLVQKEQKRVVSHLILGSGTLWLLTALVPNEFAGGSATVLAFFDEGFHRLAVRVSETSNRNYRDLLAKMGEAAPKGSPCEIPIRHGARLFFEMLDFSQDPTPPPDVEEARRLLTPYHDPGTPPYVYEIMDPGGLQTRRLTEQETLALLAPMDLSWLLFPKEDLRPFHQRIQDVTHSVLVVSGEIKEERQRLIVREAADALCTGKRRLLFRRFFEEQALWLKTQGKEVPARDALLTATHLASSAPAGENPVVCRMVVESLRRHWPEDEGAREQEEVREAFYRTDSGLIVPR